MIGVVALVLFTSTIPFANWMIGNVGTVCEPHGPCLLPVGFGLMAPSGVLVVGVALVLRDAVHSLMGWRWALASIIAGSALSWSIAYPALAMASAAAFLLSEIGDLLVYAPMRKSRPIAAVFLSGVVGAAIDSAVFLWVAFGSLDFIAGQILGKTWMTLLAVMAIIALRKKIVAGARV